MISERDRDELRSSMPEFLYARCGVENLNRSFRCPSPTHDDRDPSAHYYKNDNTVHCFGCGKTWDVFSLVGELDGIVGFAEQARAVAHAIGYRLADGASSSVYYRQKKQQSKAHKTFDKPKAVGMDCYEAIENAFSSIYAPENDVARRYLRWRGLDDGDIVKYALGFTRNPREISPKFSVYEPNALGFIVIPFFTDSKCSATNYCMMRTVSRQEVRNKEWRPKGIATPLWNEWMLSTALGDVYVTEGIIDAMALSKITGEKVMALGGIANARRFAQVLHATPPDKRPQKLIVCMDEDRAGRNCSDKICTDLNDLRIPHAVLPPYPGGAKDADEWLMAGRGNMWEFELHKTSPLERPLYYTRWL